ncbi:MAG: hypothetical protein LQ339_005985 [Xanthoria mediterranea]|nr:MAG: hypothetical protein LQ339_005985 [Xanthoria mediterranea]
MSSSLADRFAAFKRSDEERQDFIQLLIETNAKLENDLKTANSDHLDQLNSRRLWQEKAQSYETKLKETTTKGFLLCLIDGDGYLFDDKLISQGAAGGGEAANRLLNNIKRHIQQYEGAFHWKIVVRIYANIEGFLQKFAYIGFIEEEKALRHFVAGFTQSQPLFDFVDAGQGKERADHKIKEQLSLFINNIQCKHIMLGVAHDNGYVPTLDPYKNHPTVGSRISLLKPGRLGREFYGLPFEVVQFDSIFRTVELPNDRPPHKLQQQLVYLHKPPFQPAASPSAPPTADNRLTTRCPIYPGPVLLNKDGERVDEYLGTPSEFAETVLKSLISNGNRLCNIHHLQQRCNAGPKCPYSHELTLEGEELVAFALKARLTPCHAASKCRSRMCVLGHVCPHGANCTRKKTCYFYKVHHVDPRVDHEVTDSEGEAPAYY